MYFCMEDPAGVPFGAKTMWFKPFRKCDGHIIPVRYLLSEIPITDQELFEKVSKYQNLHTIWYII